MAVSNKNENVRAVDKILFGMSFLAGIGIILALVVYVSQGWVCYRVKSWPRAEAIVSEGEVEFGKR